MARKRGVQAQKGTAHASSGAWSRAGRLATAGPGPDRTALSLQLKLGLLQLHLR